MEALLHRHEPSAWDRFQSFPRLFIAQKIYAFCQRLDSRSVVPINDETVRVVCISDTHNGHEAIAPLPDGDILIHAGDLTQSGTLEELERALRWLDSQPHVIKLFIAGNHDAALTDPAAIANLRIDYPRLTYLQDSETTVVVHGRTLNVYGSPQTPKHGSWPFQYPRDPSSSSRWSGIPAYADILITHGPPACHLDLNGRTGCVGLLQAIWTVRPKLHVFGHIHAARGEEKLSWTVVQSAYERVMEKRGWWDFMVLCAVAFGECARRLWNGQGTAGTPTTLVNASVVGGYRDELRRGAIVVDI